jgi:hypothetical protein
MAEEPFEIGAEVSCSDGACGELSRVVVDPVARTITHLVVEPAHGHAPGRLVPVGLAQTGSHGIRRLAEAAAEWRFIVGWCEEHGYSITADWPRRELQRLEAGDH